MKKLLLASAGLLALGVVSASAADLPRQMPAKAPAYIPPPPYNWTGFYIGLNGGGGWGHSDYSAPLTDSSSLSGGLVGGTVGYNYQMGQVVFGLEGDIDWADLRGSTTCAVATSCETRNDWLATARGRLGYAFDRFLPYVTGGAAFGDIKTSVTGFPDTTATRTGWTLGGGIEYAISGPWTAKVEYLHVDLGNAGTSVPGANASYTADIVRGGINYRF
jgi:outer membrane immunogenic protein